MNCELIVVGKTDLREIEALTAMYAARINFYTRFDLTVIPDLRNTKSMSQSAQCQAEGELIAKRLTSTDHVVLLDERGKEMNSVEFADFINRRMSSGIKKLVFVIGGPYGFSDQIYSRADAKLSLSQMTFSHQIVRAIFAEQLYRAFTIIRGEPYHHR